MSGDRKVLVVGAAGFIGRALVESFAEDGIDVIKTTRDGAAGTLPLDLSTGVSDWRPPDGISIAYLCAAVTSLDQCEARPDETRAINVEANVQLAKALCRRGASVIFPSTNLVFDGSIPFQKPDAPYSPRTEYGRQKAEAEKLLLELDRACIVRLTKVLAPGNRLLAGWINSLKRGEPIQPFSDMVMAPISLFFVTKVLRLMEDRPMSGLLQISGSEDVSYEQAAQHIGRRLGVEQKLIQPRSAASAGVNADRIPKFTTLDTERLKTECGLAAPDVWEMLDTLLAD